MSVQFAMICYVNRSGSTLLSRLLSDWFEEAFVFPEVSFLLHILVDRSRGKILSGQTLFDAVVSDPRIDALGLDHEALRSICNQSSSDNIPKFLVRLATASACGKRFRVIVFKFETLIYLYDDVIQVFPNIKIIHLVRDPRAVVNSMLRSNIPEKPGFNMARNSVVFSSKHWRHYVQKMSLIEQERPVLTIQYESIGQNNDDILIELENYLSVPAAASGYSGKRYHVSKIDKTLHAHVFESFMDERTYGWKTELPMRSLALVETLCKEGMRRFHYAAVADAPSRLAMLGAHVAHLVYMISHNVRTVGAYIRRKDGLKALSRRAVMYVKGI